MTSVRSHLLPSSGNNILACLVVALLLLWTGCARKTATTKTNKKETATTHNQPKTKAAPEENPPENVVVKPEKKTPKQEFHIALLLPFFLSSMDVDSGQAPVVNSNSVLGIEYYQGVLLALDSLKSKGLDAVVHVYDCQNDEEKVKQLLAKKVLETDDLIIGPVYNGQARLVAEMAKKSGVPVVSPLSPADNITTQNPDFYVANPPLDVHCEALFRFATDNFSGANYVVLYPNNVADKNVVLLENLADKKKVKLTKAPLKNKGQDTGVKNYLSKTKKNVIFIPSMDLPFLVNASKELVALAADYDITVMGMPIWGIDENLRMDYINTLKVHFTSPFYVEPGFYNKNAGLCKDFIDRFGNEPSENAIKGYDLMNYLGGLMLRYGSKFPDKMLKDDAPAHCTRFEFRPYKITDPESGKETVEFIENKFVNILRYQDHTLKLMTPSQ